MLNARKLPATWKLRVSPRLCVTASAVILVVAVACALAASNATQNTDDQGFSCSNLPNFSALKNAIASATAAETSGLNNQMWATLVNRDGVVCAVAFSGVNRAAQCPGSRVISAQKANTANAFSLDASSNSNGSGQAGGLALSTANLYSAVQPGGSLYGLQHSNPVDIAVAYLGPATNFGTDSDPMVAHRIGGVNVFGGGLALYNSAHVLVGAIGLSCDSSCADHNIAWRTRNDLGLDHVPAGVSGDRARPDNIVYDITPQAGQQEGVSASGWGHPTCSSAATALAGSLPATSR